MPQKTNKPDAQSIDRLLDEIGDRILDKAEQGDVEAQSVVGNKYLEGRGVTQDDSEAVKWFRKAAEQGCPSSQYSLGFMYLEGRGITQDDGEAVKWFRKAAEQGNPSGQGYLGFMYARGRGISQDNEEAYFWLNLSLAQHNLTATREFIDLVYKELSPQQRESAKKRLEEWQSISEN